MRWLSNTIVNYILAQYHLNKEGVYMSEDLRVRGLKSAAWCILVCFLSMPQQGLSRGDQNGMTGGNA